MYIILTNEIISYMHNQSIVKHVLLYPYAYVHDQLYYNHALYSWPIVMVLNY